jgi:glyoxylase-like metal-dependent hydrolase (beta-lactamase superfamily II)
LREVDLRYLGTGRAICCYAGIDGGWLVDPGPELTHRELLAALPSGWAPERILLTHIHFDHAGATGRLLERWPQAEVWVHERGARHLVDPSRLLASARRIWGDDFTRVWGEVVPVPESSLRVLEGDETIDGWKVAYTPGHASHHVTYLEASTGTAFVGDVAGARIGDGPVLPPSPPPDIDRELWLRSLDLVEKLGPSRLAITHFGTVEPVGAHLEALREQLHRWSELAREVDAVRFADATREAVAAATSDPAAVEAYERANPPGMLWGGWDRYWRGRAAAAEG